MNRSLVRRALAKARGQSHSVVGGPPSRRKDALMDANLTTSGPQHLELARLMSQGMTVRQAAQCLGISPKTARTWVNSPMFRERFNELVRATDEAVAALNARLQMIAGDALDLVHEYITSESEDLSPKVKLEAAKTALAHAGVGKSQKDAPMTTQVNIAIQSIDSAVKAVEVLRGALESGRGDVVDVPSASEADR